MKNTPLMLLTTAVLMAVFISCTQDESAPTDSSVPEPDAAEVAALQYVADHMDELQLRDGIDAVKVYRIQTDRYGDTHVRMNQTYLGRRVHLGTAIVHLDADLKPVSVTSGLIAGINADMRRKLSAHEAKSVAAADFMRDGYIDYEVSGLELLVKRTDSGDLLCWSLIIQSRTQAAAREYFIDAHNGSIVTWLDQIIY